MPFELFEHIRTQAEARQRRHDNPAAAAEAAAAEVVDDNLGFAKDRAISRLTEMQVGLHPAGWLGGLAAIVLTRLVWREAGQPCGARWPGWRS
jgi:hypothetical protein